MNLLVSPSSRLRGRIIPPPSKSYSIRAFIIASLGEKSLIVNPSFSDDVRAAIHCCKSLGARIKKIKNNIWEVRGVKGKIHFPSVLNTKESGTTLRFLLSLAALSPKKMTIAAEGTLKSRPNKPLILALRKIGAQMQGRGKNESAPIIINKGKIKSGKIKIDGTLSSQFISSLLIAMPLLDGDSIIEITGDCLVSAPYIGMTLSVLKRAGIRINKKNQRTYKIRGKQAFKGLKVFKVPVDYGLSGFLMAAACLADSNIILEIEKDNLVQADKKIIDLLKRMGIKLDISRQAIKIKGPQQIRGGEFDCCDCPDLVPVLGVLALFGDKKSRIYGIGHLHAKESDRISDFRQELIKLGAKVLESQDEMIIYPIKEFRQKCVINPRRDHRLAMAFAVLGLKTLLTIKDIECVSKSYPSFLQDLRKLGANLKIT
ncbi:MAG: 3-phosphoshikimate 1-carboxyvinyltransferase [Candidatus Omnitrophica bacterium]|nr:3-phosphoshikimate 1-carboxyvinyltransferase [Candidatus Omnitrophota bacterium]